MVKFLYYRISSVVLPVRADRQEVKKAMVLSYVKRFLRLYAGLFLCAVSILLAIQGGVGVTPWDVFHMGIQNITGISYGTVNILVGLCILTTSIVLGEPIGFGTLCNTLSVGYLVCRFAAWIQKYLPTTISNPCRSAVHLLSSLFSLHFSRPCGERLANCRRLLYDRHRISPERRA